MWGRHLRSLCICASVSCSTAPLSPLSYLEERAHSSARLPARPSQVDCGDFWVCAACASEHDWEPKQPIILLIWDLFGLWMQLGRQRFRVAGLLAVNVDCRQSATLCVKVKMFLRSVDYIQQLTGLEPDTRWDQYCFTFLAFHCTSLQRSEESKVLTCFPIWCCRSKKQVTGSIVAGLILCGSFLLDTTEAA